MDSRLQEFSTEARALLNSYRVALERLPQSFPPLVVRQLRGWPALFPPERDALSGLLRTLGGLDANGTRALFHRFDAFALPNLAGLDPIFDEEKVLERCLERFKRDGTYQAWRTAVDDVFQRLSALDEPAAPGTPKLVYVALGEGTGPAQTLGDAERRFLPYFTNHLEPAGALLTSLSGGIDADLLLELFRGSPPIKLWAIDAGNALRPRAATFFGFEQLRPVMDRVTRKMAGEMLAGVSGPEALYAKVTGFKALDLGLPAFEDARIHRFAERVVLEGSGALLINNSFAEWAALSALRRVEPDLLLVRFAQRRRFVPLRQLDPFQAPGAPGADLAAEDAGESLEDADVLAYYVWLETRKNARYRDRTHFLFHLEGSGAALLAGPGVRKGARVDAPVRPEDLASTLAHLIRNEPSRFGGNVIDGALDAGRS
jgi:hypothetical protein